MYAQTYLDGRDELIEFSSKLGAALQRHPRKKPWIIDLEGDPDSGKSLIALAVDRVFNPQFYRQGITLAMSADRLPGEFHETKNPVYFCNYAYEIMETSEDYDDFLGRLIKRMPFNKVIMISNIYRSLPGVARHEFNYRSGNLHSDRLDIAIEVRKQRNSDERHVGVTFKNRSLRPALNLVTLPSTVP